MTRREAVAGLASLATLPLLDRVSAESRDRIDHLGLAAITVRSQIQKDPASTLEEVARIGYRDLDMYIYETRLMPKETRTLLDRYGLTCRSARVATPAIYRGWERSLDAANRLGAKWITLANVPWEERTVFKDWEEMADVFNRVGAAAKQRGLRFVYHNHDFELAPLEGKVPHDYLVANTDTDLVRFQLDIYWLTKGGRDPVAEINRLGSRIASLHLKDMDRTPEREITPPGSGIFDFAPILAAARRARVSDLYVEVDGPRDGMDAARTSYTHLTSVAF
ncbi:MAG TPA: sugar phosphate isomerase/epimerase [Gemmatimonadaceae bacterium]|nr:sugar phosphate isomerase/epimerase [Gemmatimonadaceae bacterium]